jgi:hypothetical protein
MTDAAASFILTLFIVVCCLPIIDPIDDEEL